MLLHVILLALVFRVLVLVLVRHVLIVVLVLLVLVFLLLLVFCVHVFVLMLVLALVLNVLVVVLVRRVSFVLSLVLVLCLCLCLCRICLSFIFLAVFAFFCRGLSARAYACAYAQCCACTRVCVFARAACDGAWLVFSRHAAFDDCPRKKWPQVEPVQHLLQKSCSLADLRSPITGLKPQKRVRPSCKSLTKYLYFCYQIVPNVTNIDEK